MQPRLAVRDLRVTYPFAERPALTGVSFDVASGECLLVVGSSGSGKSSLALALAGLIPRAVEAELSGSVRVGGREIAKMRAGEAALSVGVVFQDPEAQFSMLTVEDEIAFGLENLSCPRKEMDVRIDKALAAVDLVGWRKKRLDRLSGGMKQRVALACVLAMEPPVIVFDEPTANLDPQATADFFSLLGNLVAQRQHSVLLVEHKLEAAAHLADRVLVLSAGQIVALAAPQDVFSTQGPRLQEMGVWQPYASEVAQRLAETGIQLSPHPLRISQLAAATCGSAAHRRSTLRVIDAMRVAQTVVESAPTSQEALRQESEALAFTHVSYDYPTASGAALGVKEVDWQIHQGRFVAVVGPNGAGKSTLSRLALGLLTPSNGEIRLFGRPLPAYSRKEIARCAGLVFQNPEHQFLTDTVWDELALSLRAAGMAEPEDPDRLQALLHEFGLAGRAAANPFTLSQGEKRRLSVACMLAADQRLLILDEPTFGQDRINAYRIMDRIAARHRAGCTVVMITHDMRMVWEFAQEVAVVCAGRLVVSGTVDSIFEDEGLLARAGLELPLPLQLKAQLRMEQEVGA